MREGTENMRQSYIELRYEVIYYEIGELEVRASHGGFAGVGRAHFSSEKLEEFSQALQSLPIAATPRVEIRGGYGSPGAPMKDEEVFLALAVYRTNSQGHLAIQVRVCDGNGWPPESCCRAAFEVPSTYESVAQLGRGLAALLRGTCPMVRVETDPDRLNAR